MKKYFTREVKIGLMVITAIFLLYFGLNFLKGIDIFQKTSFYYGKFEQLDGLVPSSPVFVKGYKVGQVEEVKYDFSQSEAFTVKISVANDIKLPDGAIIELFDNGLMGGKAIQLVYSPITAGQKMHAQNDVLPTHVSNGLMASVAGNLMPKIESMTNQADSLLRSVRKITDSQQLNNSLNSIEKTTADLAVTSSQLKGMMSNQLPVMLNDVNTITGNFKQVSGNLSKIDFANSFASLDRTLNNLQIMSDKLNSNDGSLGLLLNDKNLYINLSNTANNADKLMIDLKQNPKRYVHFSVFGGKSK